MNSMIAPQVVIHHRVGEEWKERIRDLLLLGNAVDCHGNFHLKNDPASRKAIRVHVTLLPKKTCLRYKPSTFSSMGYPCDPFVAIEDEAGEFHGVEHCHSVVETTQIYGALFLREIDDSLWLAGREVDSDIEQIDAAAVMDGLYEFRQIREGSWKSERLKDVISIAGSPYEGLFILTDEEMPYLIMPEWWGPVLLGEGADVSPEASERARALVGALHEIVELICQDDPLPA